MLPNTTKFNISTLLSRQRSGISHKTENPKLGDPGSFSTSFFQRFEVQFKPLHELDHGVRSQTQVLVYVISCVIVDTPHKTIRPIMEHAVSHNRVLFTLTSSDDGLAIESDQLCLPSYQGPNSSKGSQPPPVALMLSFTGQGLATGRGVLSIPSSKPSCRM
jgi:hypothetical protein